MTDPTGSDPTLGRFLDRHPELAPAVTQVLERAAEVRRAKALAFVDEELPAPGPEPGGRLETWGAAVVRLEELAGAPSASRGGVERAVRRALLAVAELRAESHRFAPRRRTVSPERRRALLQALDLFGTTYAILERQAREAHVRQLPWQLELATCVAPGTRLAEMEITGYELAGTPAARLHWGERCYLTGALYPTDSHARPAPRHRSLERNERVLSPEAFGLFGRMRRALERLEERFPGVCQPAARQLPELFDPFVEEGCHPTFSRLGLFDFPSLAVSLSNLLLRYRARPLFGSREPKGSYRWESFAATRDAALALAHGLEGLGLRPGARLGFVASRNGQELYLADFAAVFAGLVSVGLHDGMDDEGMLAAAEQSGIEALVADGPSLKRLASMDLHHRCPQLDHVVVFDRDGPTPPEGVATLDLERLLSPPPPGWVSASGIGPETPVLYGDTASHATARGLGISIDGDQDLYTVIFTSGSTGRPKGTPVTRRRWAEEMCVEVDLWPYVGVSFQPTAIAADRGSVWRAVANGGRVGFARRGAGLFADVRAIRPTLFDVPPVIWSSLYTEYKRAIADPDLGRREAARIRRRFRDSLGGRLAFMATGGAPTDPGVCRAMESIFGIPMSEGYGTTETGHIAASGVLLPGLDYRLIDRPDLGYTREDRPWPRGELAVRTPRTTSRYDRDEKSSREGFTEDGYFRTGDLVEIGPGRRIRILGRSKQVFKLAGAEMVSPEAVERCLGASEMVEAVLVTAVSTRSQVVAVVVPTLDELGDEELLAELRALASRARLRPCEMPVGVVVEPKRDGQLPWTVANGLLTPSFKLNRPALEARYRPQVEAVYGAADRARGVAFDIGAQARRDREGTRERLMRLVAAILSRPVGGIDPKRSFAEQGGDSLGAVELVLRLEQVFAGKGTEDGVWNADPAEVVALPLEVLAARLTAAAEEAAVLGASKTPEARETGPGKPSPPRTPSTPATGATAPASEPEAGTSSGPSPRAGNPSNEELAALANEDAVSGPRPAREAPQATGADLFLTGGTGFLGAHLLHELAATVPPGARIWALVRAPDDEGARRRVAAALEKASLPVPAIGAPESTSACVVPLAGSLEGERLGLSEARWKELTQHVGMIYHVAALVTGQSDYGSLRGPNVVGTRRLLELAATGPLKGFHFVSSLNVALLLQHVAGGRQAGEATPLPERVSAATLSAQPAYAVTKWASERMVQEAWAASGGAFRASVSRPALLTWSTATGVANEEDWLPRVLASCLQIRAALSPEVAGIPCWAAETETSARGLDMVPVDFVARAVARLGERTRRGELPPAPGGGALGATAPTFHVSNLAPAETGLVTIPRLMDLLVTADLREAPGEPPLRYLPRRDWLLEAELQSAPALPLLEQLQTFQPALPRTRATSFAAAMSGEQCPGIDLESVATYVRRWHTGERG